MQDGKSTPTLIDVAKLAGVSTATVSRCLNAPDKVAQDTRDRVKAAVDQLGYAPNFGAQAMATRRTKTIAAVIPTMENAIFAKGLQAFQEELRGHGYTMLVASSSYDPAIEAEQIRTLISRGADGFLLIGHDRDPALYQLLAQQNVPALVAWTFAKEQPLCSVGFDNRAAMRTLAEQILSFGHKKLAFVGSPTTANDRSRERLRGVQDAISGRGTADVALTIIETPYGIEEGAAAFAKLMSNANPPTAIICGNDVLAVGALKEARRTGFSVPHDVSITGFDGLELALMAEPPLTTVAVPHQEMGRIAARALVRMATGDPTPNSVELQTEVQMGGTLGPARL